MSNFLNKYTEYLIGTHEMMAQKFDKIRRIYRKLRPHLGQMIRFGLVGILNTLIGLGTILLLQNGFSVNPYLANICGYSLGLINSFVWNKCWTFKSRRSFRHELVPFFTVFAVSFGIQFGIVALSLELLHFGKTVSQILGNVCYTAVNFAGNKVFTFRSTGVLPEEINK